MGYIKKLKNNELVGGTDKTTIYPVTSTEAVFEEVIEDGESNFKSQKFLNNNITGDRINEGTITDYNIAVGTITKGKLTPQVQTMLDEGQKKALTPKGNYNLETEYEALDLVFDPVTNSSYISLVTPNVGHPVDENAEGYEEGWWEKTLDGTAVNTAQATINAKVDQLNNQVTNAIGQAQQDVQDLINETADALQEATNDAIGATEAAMAAAHQKVSDAQIGYYISNTAAATALKQTTTNIIGEDEYVPASGGAVKIYMKYANTSTGTVELQFGSNTATKKRLLYNGEYVSQNNTWDNGEVISVYYDPTYNNNVGAYQATNSQGGSNKKIDAYLYGDLRTLAVGQTYKVNEAVKTIDKQLFRVVKEIKAMNIIDFVSIGDLKVYNSVTYKALKNVINFNPSTSYSNNAYAFGAPGKFSLTVGRELTGGDVAVTFGNNSLTVSTESTDSSADVASKIAEALNDVSDIGWTFLTSYNNIVATCNTHGDNSGIACSIVGGIGTGVLGDISVTTIGTDDSEEGAGDGTSTVLTISLSIGSGTISVTIGTITNNISVSSSDAASDIAAQIANATWEGWNVSVDSELNTKVNILAINAGAAVAPSISENIFGVTGVSETLFGGSTALCKYDSSNVIWGTVTLASYAADAAEIDVTPNGEMWQKVSVEWLSTISNGAVKQAVVPKLYDDFGLNTDGTLTQQFITDNIACYENVPFTRFSLYKGFCLQDGTNAKWLKNTNASFYYKSVKIGQRFIIEANDTYDGFYAWLGAQTFDDTNIATGKTPKYAPNYPSHIKIPAGKKVLVEVPSGANYLYICNKGIATVYDRLPKYVHYILNAVNERVRALEDQDIFNLKKTIDENYWGEELDLSGYKSQQKWISGNTWYDGSSSVNQIKNGVRSQIIELTEGIYTLYAEGHNCYYSLLTSNNNTAGAVVQYYDGYNGIKTLEADSKYQFSIPKGAQCYLLVRNNKDFANDVDYSHPRVFRYKKYEDIIKDIKFADYDITDITEGVVGWVGSSSSAPAITNYGNGNAKIHSASGGNRAGVNLGVIPSNSLLRVQFDIEKDTCAANGDGPIWALDTISGDASWLVDVGGKNHFITGYKHHYNFVYNKGSKAMLGFSTNFVYSDIIISNFKLELLTPKSNSGETTSNVDADCVAAASWPKFRDADTAARGKSATFLHFSDIHGSGSSAAAIYKYYTDNKNYINDILCTGDIVNLYYSQGFDFYKNNGLTKGLLAIGNHDVSTDGEYSTFDLTKEQEFNTYYKDYIDDWGLPDSEVSRMRANNVCYYYKDYSTVRLIVLDVMVRQIAAEDTIQRQWFSDTLNSARTSGKTVVIASHYSPQSGGGTTAVIDPRTNQATSFNVLYNASTPHTPDVATSLDAYLTLLQEFITNGGNFAIWLAGHNHRDYLYHDVNYPNILVMIIGRCFSRSNDDNQNNLFTPLVANVVSVNTEDKIIKIKRVGRHRDDYMRSINTLCYDYGNNRVVYND